MELLNFPNPLLFQVTVEVTSFDESLAQTLDQMYDVMKYKSGIGLAANQVGLTSRMFVMEGPNGRMNVVNPVIVSRSVLSISIREGCLSAPGTFVIVPDRSQWVKLEYSNEKGEKCSAVLKDIYAICVQHELEHLDGKSFLSHRSIPKNIRKPLLKKWKH